jgi:hypothetical protein
MRMSLLLALVGVFIFGYSFVAESHLSAMLMGMEVKGAVDVTRMPWDGIQRSEHDWMAVRYFGLAIFIVGLACMFCGRKRSPNSAKL